MIHSYWSTGTYYPSSPQAGATHVHMCKSSGWCALIRCGLACIPYIPHISIIYRKLEATCAHVETRTLCSMIVPGWRLGDQRDALFWMTCWWTARRCWFKLSFRLKERLHPGWGHLNERGATCWVRICRSRVPFLANGPGLLQSSHGQTSGVHMSLFQGLCISISSCDSSDEVCSWDVLSHRRILWKWERFLFWQALHDTIATCIKAL